MNTDSNDPNRPVELTVKDQRITAQITVLDASYRPITTAVGELRTQLSPGVYEVESAFGQNRQRKFVVLNPGSPQTVHFHSPETGMSSAAPLPGTTTHHGHQTEAEEWSRQVTMEGSPGGSARLFIFIRTIEPEKYRDHYDRGLRVLNERGKLISDFKEGVRRDPDRGLTGLTVDLPPGGYQLYQGGRGRTARYQPIWLSEGWETQVFIPALELPQIDELSYFMARRGTGFHSSDDDYLTSEVVLDGICRGVNLASSRQMRSMLSGKFENPWLGILALHAMRLDGDFDPGLRQEVQNNLHSLVGDHPDLRVLGLEPGRAPDQPFTFPPILSASLKLLRAHASQYPGTVKLFTLASRIFDTLITDSPWVAWHRLPPLKRVPKPIPEGQEAFFHASGSKWVLPTGSSKGLAFSDTKSLKKSLPDLFANPDTPEENPLVANVLALSEAYALEDRRGDITYCVDPAPLLMHGSPEQISRQLNLPVEKVERALSRLREMPELLTQPGKMTLTEQSVAETVLSRRSLKQDASVSRSAESSLMATIEAVKQARMSLKRLANEKNVPPDLEQWLEQLKRLRKKLEDQAEAVLLVDANTQIVYASRAFEMLVDSPLEHLAIKRVATSSHPVLSSLKALTREVSAISLETSSGKKKKRYQVRRQRFIDEGSSQLFAIVYRIKPANLQPLDASVHKELRRSLSNITYYASVMPTCNAEERLRYTGYIEHDLSSLDSLF